MKAQIQVSVEAGLLENERLISFKCNENAPIEAFIQIHHLVLAEPESDKGKMNVTVIESGETFSLIQIPGETMLGHKNAIVSNMLLEFV